MTQPSSRRQFLSSAASAATLTALSQSRVLGANDRVRLGFIGVGNRGDQLLDAFLEHGDTEIAAVCDLRQDYMDFAASKSRGAPVQFSDYRRLIESSDIDAVVIATPDHWHALMTIDACEGGKDVYVEKPLSLTVVEGRKMVEAVRRNRRVSQVGIHRRSSPVCQEAVGLIREGEIGHVSHASTTMTRNEAPIGIGHPADSAPPPDLDWEMWLGPAPKVPYNVNRTLYKFRWFWDYSGGQVTNFGAHGADMIQWALDRIAPKAVTAMGGRYVVEDNREIPDTATILWEYEGGTLANFTQINGNGADPTRSFVEFRGTKGTAYVDGNAYEIVPEKVRREQLAAYSPLRRGRGRGETETLAQPRRVKGSSDTAFHARNFLDCVKSRKRCNCDIEIGHRSTSATLIANIALRTRSFLEWDAAAERFTNNEEANNHLHYEYRSPWKLPG